MGWPTWAAGMPAWIGPEAAGYASGSWRSPGYRSARIRGRWCKVFFVAVAVVAAIAAMLCLQGMSYVANNAAGFDRMSYAEAVQWVQGTAGSEGWVFLLSIGLVISVPVWFGRTVDNLPALAGGTPRRSPGQAISWWFVPIANLVMPFIMVREAWHRYATPTRNGRDWTLIVWWLAYNVGFTLAVLSTGMVFGGESNKYQTRDEIVRQVQSGLTLGVLGFGLIVVAAILGFFIVNQIGHRAGERAAMLGLDGPEARWAGQPGYPGAMLGGPGSPYPPVAGYGVPLPGQYAPPVAPYGPPPEYPPYPVPPAPPFGATGPMPQGPGQPGGAGGQPPSCRACSTALAPGMVYCPSCGTPVSG